MATIDSWGLIKELMNNRGYYMDDPRVHMIVEYTNAYGNRTWGITYVTEPPERRLRYLEESEYVRDPKVIWRAE